MCLISIKWSKSFWKLWGFSDICHKVYHVLSDKQEAQWKICLFLEIYLQIWQFFQSFFITFVEEVLFPPNFNLSVFKNNLFILNTLNKKLLLTHCILLCKRIGLIWLIQIWCQIEIGTSNTDLMSVFQIGHQVLLVVRLSP